MKLELEQRRQEKKEADERRRNAVKSRGKPQIRIMNNQIKMMEMFSINRNNTERQF